MTLIARVDAFADAFQAQYGGQADLLFLVLLTAEDRRARWHLGVDPISILRAIFRATKTGRINALSTIEQQLVRTLKPRRASPWRSKPAELVLATWIALRVAKRRIWAAYLYCAYFGADWDTLDEAIVALAADSRRISLDEACALIAHLRHPMQETQSIAYSNRHRSRTRQLIAACRVAGFHDRDRRGPDNTSLIA
ncbi:transglycosylase domain-containing protein [Brevundimonas sp.]